MSPSVLVSSELGYTDVLEDWGRRCLQACDEMRELSILLTDDNQVHSLNRSGRHCGFEYP